MTKPAPFYTDDFSHEWFVEWNTDTDSPVFGDWWISVEVHEPPHAVRPVATIETIEGKVECLHADDLRKLAGMFAAAAHAMDQRQTAEQKAMTAAAKRVAALRRAEAGND